MKSNVSTALALLLAAAAAAAGYWWGSGKTGGAAAHSSATASAPASGAPPARRILYYRNPMGLPDTSPTPKKDQMGMDYIPVYEGEEQREAASGIRVSAEKMQRLGVKTERAALRELTRAVRAVGTLQIDERRVHTIAPRFEGWIERLHVNTTGQPVGPGQPLMEVYSPDLVTAQQEYLIAQRAVESARQGSVEMQAGMQQLAASALARLRNWDISEVELKRLQQDGAARRTLTLRAPAGGVVLDKPPVTGMRFMPGEALYRIADLSALWLLAEVFEQDLALVRHGQSAAITVNAYPGEVFTGRVAFVYPTLGAETRTVKVRIELPNRGGRLKPEMYAEVTLDAPGGRGTVLAVPEPAVIDSGTRQTVLVQREPGRFESRTVKLGARGNGYVEVRGGLAPDEEVVTRANFLIDSEANLTAALGAFSPGGAAPRPAGAAHTGRGTVDAIDPVTRTLTITHEPIASLKWPAMTMDFTASHGGLLAGLKPAQPVQFEFVQKAAGEFVVVRISPAGPVPAAAAGHKGH